MYVNKQIEKPIFSFHLSWGDRSDYMTFGGYNKYQFHGELLTFKLINTAHWSVGIMALYLGDDIIQTYDNYVGLADTGTSLLIMPEKAYDAIVARWRKQIGS